jgi:hypothetical protein
VSFAAITLCVVSERVFIVVVVVVVYFVIGSVRKLFDTLLMLTSISFWRQHNTNSTTKV